MARNKSNKLPHFRSINDLVKFFDTHDLGQCWNEMAEARFEVDIKKGTHVFAVDTELANELTRITKSRQISSEALINTWVKEKIQEQI